MIAALAFTLLLLPQAPQGQAPPDVIVRTKRADEGPVVVGQPARFSVQVLSQRPLGGTPKLELPRLDGALLVESSGSSVLGTEKIGDTEYMSQTRDVSLFGARAGKVAVPAFAVKVMIAPSPAEKPVERALQTDAFDVEITLPPGAENVPGLVCAKTLAVTEAWSSAGGDVRAGQGLTRTITVSSSDLPSMLLPAPREEPVAGVKRLAKPPALTDHDERGERHDERVDVITYVFQQPGTVTLPALEYAWWNLDQKRVEKITLAARTVNVAPDPNAAAAASPGVAPAAAPPPASSRVWMIVAAVVIAAAAGAAFVRRARRDDPATLRERAAFAALRDACAGNDATAGRRALYAWLDAAAPFDVPPSTLEAFAREHTELTQPLAGLDRAASAGERWDGAPLAAALASVRSRRAGRHASRPAALPPLNPGAESRAAVE